MKTDYEPVVAREEWTVPSLALAGAVLLYIVFLLFAVTGCASTPAAPVAKAESSCDDATQTCVVTYEDMRAVLQRAYQAGLQRGLQSSRS